MYLWRYVCSDGIIDFFSWFSTWESFLYNVWPRFFLWFYLFFLLILSFLLNLLAPPGECMSGLPIDIFQATVFTKPTPETKADLWPGVPGGISVRHCFLSINLPALNAWTGFRSCLHIRCTERIEEAHVEKKGWSFFRHWRDNASYWQSCSPKSQSLCSCHAQCAGSISGSQYPGQASLPK